jgi:hypothetical protein
MKNEKRVNDNDNHNDNCHPDGKLRLRLGLRLNEEKTPRLLNSVENNEEN